MIIFSLFRILIIFSFLFRILITRPVITYVVWVRPCARVFLSMIDMFKLMIILHFSQKVFTLDDDTNSQIDL
jgi:hypothetical protein